VNGIRGDAGPIQLLREPVRAVLRPREDEGLLPVPRAEERGKKLRLALAVHPVGGLVDAVRDAAEAVYGEKDAVVGSLLASYAF
jgi:hypothetical protein